MIVYIIKVILCSAFFYGVYKVLFENEKILLFNRLYLLGSIIFSFIIPFIVVESTIKFQTPEIESIVYLPIKSAIKPLPVVGKSSEQHVDYSTIISLVYLFITLIMLIRFVSNLYIMNKRKTNNSILEYGKYRIILLKEKVTPHSFLNLIFFNEDDYQAKTIEDEILQHELTHVKLKHSFDILFMEFLISLFWFNPFLYLYRRSIKLNHEYLADEAVINIYHQPKKYQYLLIQKSSGLSPKMSSNFNYSITKKRLIMMTKTKSLRKVCLKQMATIPMLAVSIFLFSKTAVAQISTANSTVKEVPATQKGVSKELLDEYEQIVAKHVIKNPVKKKSFTQYKDFSDEEISKLKMIYLKMSKVQQKEQTVIFIQPSSPLKKVIPTDNQIEMWKNSEIYGVWINGRKVNNSLLEEYKPSDFSQVFVSKLYGKAKSNVSYLYQVDLMTNEYYDAYLSKTKEQKDEYFMAFKSAGKEIDF